MIISYTVSDYFHPPPLPAPHPPPNCCSLHFSGGSPPAISLLHPPPSLPSTGSTAAKRVGVSRSQRRSKRGGINRFAFALIKRIKLCEKLTNNGANFQFQLPWIFSPTPTTFPLNDPPPPFSLQGPADKRATAILGHR